MSPLLPLALAFVSFSPPQPAIDWGIGLVILAVAGYLIVVSEVPGWALAVFSSQGCSGSSPSLLTSSPGVGGESGC